MAASLSTNTNGYANSVSIAAEVFSEYGNFIRTVIRYRVKNEAKADDLFQDFFLFLVSKSLPANVRNVKSYLYRAITNDIIDATRRVEKYQTRIHRYANRIEYSATGDKPENVLIEVEEMNKMFELIEKRLPHSEAQAITLRYRNHYSIKEVANQLDVNKRSASRYISVGLRKIRRSLTAKRGN